MGATMQHDYHALLHLPYCPGQVPMGTRSSSAKNWGWAVTRRRCFKWFNYLPAGANPSCEVSCQGVLNRLASSLWPCFIEASPTVEKDVMCYKADQLVALLPSFHGVYSPWTGVCELDVVAPKAHQINYSYVSSADLPSDSLCKDLFSMVGG